MPLFPRQSFGAIHLLNGGLNVTSFFLLLISGSLVGIMFGLATYKFNTIWASITLHFCWNLSQLLLITEKESQYSIWQYVVHTNNIAITAINLVMKHPLYLSRIHRRYSYFTND